MAYTFLQLRGRVNDIPHRPKNQDASEIDALVNESYAYVVAELNILQKSVTKTLTAADGDYNLVTDFGISDYAAMRVIFYTAANGLSTFEPLAPTSLADLTAMRLGNPSATSPSVCYAMAGWANISFQPLPATGDTATFYYTAYPVAMTLAADTPVSLPQHLHHLIVGHAACVAMETIDINVANRMHADFEQNELNRARRWINNSVSSLPFQPGRYKTAVRWPSDAWYGR